MHTHVYVNIDTHMYGSTVTETSAACPARKLSAEGV